MNVKNLAAKLKFSTLAHTMVSLGMDPDEVDDKREAIKAIYDRFKVDGQALEYACPVCKADIPDLESCPFCGVSFTDEDESRTYVGAKKGRRPKGYTGPSGWELLRALVKSFGIPNKNVKHRKSVVSLWFTDGMICRCFVGTYSVRIQVPFPSERYGEKGVIVMDYDKPVKNMAARVYLEAKSDIKPVVEILKMTVSLKTADRPNRTVGRPRKPIPPKEDKPERRGRRNRPIQV